MKILKVICENFVNAKPEVIKWNSWDGEHLRTVHGAYVSPIFLMRRPGDGLFVDRFKIPFLPLRVKTLVFTTQWDNENQISFTLTPFFIAKNTINVTEVRAGYTRVRVTYEFSGNWFQSLLFPIYKIMIQKWNKVVWEEDLPLKIRRQKALEYGFIDFAGIPADHADRKDRSAEYKCEIPVPQTSGIKEAMHPFFTDRN